MTRLRATLLEAAGPNAGEQALTVVAAPLAPERGLHVEAARAHDALPRIALDGAALALSPAPWARRRGTATVGR